MQRFSIRFFFWWLLIVTAMACSSGNSQQSRNPLRIFAAASLTSVMPEVAVAFQETHPNTNVEFNFAASSILAKQIDQGAEADIYLSANLQWMQFLKEKKQIRENSQMEFLGNELVLINSKNRQNIPGLQDLLRKDVQRIALADWSHVPAGMYAKSALEKIGMWEKIRPKCIPALDARAALAYVERGDVDCGIVYRSDAFISSNVFISNGIPKEIQPEILYSAAITQNSSHPTSAAFFSFLKTQKAKEIFRESGFVIPESEPID